MSLAGRICVVTGASKGIGRGIALQLGGNGATVYITGRSKDKLDSCADEIKKRGGEVRNFLEYYVKWAYTKIVIRLPNMLNKVQIISRNLERTEPRK